MQQINGELHYLWKNYSTYGRHSSAHVQFRTQFIQNKFGYACKICDTLWFEGNLKNLIHDSVEFVRIPCGLKHMPFFNVFIIKRGLLILIETNFRRNNGPD